RRQGPAVQRLRFIGARSRGPAYRNAILRDDLRFSRSRDDRDPGGGLGARVCAHQISPLRAPGLRRRRHERGHLALSGHYAGKRLEGVNVLHDAHGRPDYSYAYHYDSAKSDGPLPAAANIVGRLAWAEWPTGTSHISYDKLGRATSEVEALWDPGRSTFEAQE